MTLSRSQIWRSRSILYRTGVFAPPLLVVVVYQNHYSIKNARNHIQTHRIQILLVRIHSLPTAKSSRKIFGCSNLVRISSRMRHIRIDLDLHTDQRSSNTVSQSEGPKQIKRQISKFFLILQN